MEMRAGEGARDVTRLEQGMGVTVAQKGKRAQRRRRVDVDIFYVKYTLNAVNNKIGSYDKHLFRGGL